MRHKNLSWAACDAARITGLIVRLAPTKDTMAEPKKKRSLGFHLARGSAWTMASRWSVRLLGLVNTIVLARLLTPADFGIVAIAMIIAGAIEVFAQTGQLLALIRLQAPTRAHYDSAWTVSLLLNFGLGAIIWLVAPVTAIYFHEPRAAAVVHVVAFRTMIAGLENIGIVNFRRDLRFRAQFAYDASPSIVSFVLTLISAAILRNYWALVIGIMSQQIATICLSYLIEPYRPRISFAKVREIWSFSIWTLIRAVAFYLNTQVDKLAVGGFGGAATMGRYEVATDVGTSATAEINAPMIATLFPVMAKIQNDHAKRRELYLKVLYWSALICTSSSVGVALVTNDMVDLVLGRQWGDVKPMLPWLALAFGVLGLSSSVYSAFDVIGQPRTSARLQWVRFAALLCFIAPMAFFVRSAVAIAITRFVVTLLITPTLFMALARALELSLRDVFDTLWRPFAASLAMTVMVLACNALIAFTGPLRLSIDIALGAATYAAVVMATWAFFGRPEGPESMLLRFLAGARDRLQALRNNPTA